MLSTCQQICFKICNISHGGDPFFQSALKINPLTEQLYWRELRGLVSALKSVVLDVFEVTGHGDGAALRMKNADICAGVGVLLQADETRSGEASLSNTSASLQAY